MSGCLRNRNRKEKNVNDLRRFGFCTDTPLLPLMGPMPQAQLAQSLVTGYLGRRRIKEMEKEGGCGPVCLLFGQASHPARTRASRVSITILSGGRSAGQAKNEL